jgi:hypothetical protein
MYAYSSTHLFLKQRPKHHSWSLYKSKKKPVQYLFYLAHFAQKAVLACFWWGDPRWGAGGMLGRERCHWFPGHLGELEIIRAEKITVTSSFLLFLQ